MNEPVKKYDAPKLRAFDEKAQGFCVVEYADYARLEQECERLRYLLADWSSHFTGPKVVGGPLSSLRERTEEALSTKP